jgi:preprotein translocase subunit SecE
LLMSLLLSLKGLRLFITWYVVGSCYPFSGNSLNSRFYSFFRLVIGSILDITWSLSKTAGNTFLPIIASSTFNFSSGIYVTGLSLVWKL